LPADEAQALDATVEQLRREPVGRRYRAGYPPRVPHARLRRLGLIVHLIIQQRGSVVLLEIAWAGL
jgi:hypothetical protein